MVDSNKHYWYYEMLTQGFLQLTYFFLYLEGDRTPALAHDQEAAIGLIVEEADHDLGHPDIVADQFLGRLEDQEHQGDRLHPEGADLDHVVEVDRDQEHDICESD